MSADLAQTLIDDIEAVVRATRGVAAVHPAGPLATTLVRTGVQALGIGAGPSPVRVEQVAGDVRITVAIGVHRDAGAPQVARTAAAAIRALCAERGIPHPDLHLTVVRISGGA